MRIVIKVGTNTISNSKINRINYFTFELLCKTIADIIKTGNQVILVSSGAVGCGVVELAKYNPKYADENYTPKLKEKPYLSSVGQPILMKHYIETFAHYKKQTAQILIAEHEDLTEKLGLETIEAILKNDLIPIINENDSIYDAEFKIGDNDSLASSVARLTKADALILITDIDGLHYKKDNKLLELIPVIKKSEIDKYMPYASSRSKSNLSTGGMATKLKAAINSGCTTYIIENTQIENIPALLKGKSIGTKII